MPLLVIYKQCKKVDGTTTLRFVTDAPDKRDEIHSYISTVAAEGEKEDFGSLANCFLE